MSDTHKGKKGRTEVDIRNSPYKDGTVTANTRIGIDQHGVFLYEEEGSCFTRPGELPDKRRSPDERPEDGISTGFEGPSGLTTYHETSWLRRVTVRKSTLEVIEKHYPSTKEHLPLRLLLQYLLFDRHVIRLKTTWYGKDAPLPATMLSWMAGHLDQYLSGNFRAVDMLWWAKDELFDGAFEWTDWKRGPDPKHRRFRRLKTVSIAPAVADAAAQELEHPVSRASTRVWFDTGNVRTRQTASDQKRATYQSVQEQGAEIFRQKRNPAIPRAIQTYLNGLPIDGFNQIIGDHIEDAYDAIERLSAESPEGESDLGVRHARATLRAVEDCPKPFYEAKLNTPRLYAPASLQLLNREVRAPLVQDWISLDLKSAQLAICARQWDIGPLLEFLHDDGDIWKELTSWMGLPKPALKKALYAITFGARAHWLQGSPPSALQDALASEGDLSSEEAEQARHRLLNHPLMKALLEERNHRIEEIRQEESIKDCFGSVMELPSGTSTGANSNTTVLTLLSAESSAVEMQLLWPAFEKVIGAETRCKIMLYAFDGFYLKAADPGRNELWTQKLQNAVNQQAEELGIPTSLEREDPYIES